MRTTKSTPVKPNPMRVSRNKMQLGVFSTNTEGRLYCDECARADSRG